MVNYDFLPTKMQKKNALKSDANNVSADSNRQKTLRSNKLVRNRISCYVPFVPSAFAHCAL